MKMKILKKTAMVMAAFGAMTGVAHAQSDVTLYGLVDLFVGDASTKVSVGGTSFNADPGTSLTSGGLSGSRWGLRGSEDLGGGLKAIFQLEAGFDADDGVGSGGFDRTSKVGLSGGFGTFEMGRQYTQMFLLVDGFDAQATSAFSATKAIYGPSLLPAGTLQAPATRRNNMLQYTTPSMGGFSAAAQYAFGENGGPGVSAGRAISLSAGYADGPVAVQGVYESVKGPGAGAATAKSTGLAASYDFTSVKLLAQLVNQKDGLPAGIKENGYVLSAIVPVGAAGSFHAGVGNERIKSAGIRVVKTTSASLEYRHNLSKRTTVYAGLNHLKFDLEDASASVKEQVYGVGLRHRF